ARASTGEILIFVDADTVVTADVVRASLEALRGGAAGGGAGVEFDGRLPVYARLLTGPFNASMRLAGFAAGCYIFCSRASFDAAGGFDDALYAAEEIFFSLALGRIGRVVILRERVISS